MSDEIDRQKVEAWFDPPVKIPRPILDSMAADLAQATAKADALAIEHAELRAAAEALSAASQPFAAFCDDEAREHPRADCMTWIRHADLIALADALEGYRRLRGGRAPEDRPA